MESRTSPRPEPFDATLDPYRPSGTLAATLNGKRFSCLPQPAMFILTPAGLSATTG
jgi:hypothetical protein